MVLQQRGILLCASWEELSSHVAQTLLNFIADRGYKVSQHKAHSSLEAKYLSLIISSIFRGLTQSFGFTGKDVILLLRKILSTSERKASVLFVKKTLWEKQSTCGLIISSGTCSLEEERNKQILYFLLKITLMKLSDY